MIPIKRVRNKIPDIFTRQEILKMIETAIHPMDKALIAALYETGCRIGEMANLRIKDVHFDIYGAVSIPRIPIKMLHSGSDLAKTENRTEFKIIHACNSCIPL